MVDQGDYLFGFGDEIDVIQYLFVGFGIMEVQVVYFQVFVDLFFFDVFLVFFCCFVELFEDVFGVGDVVLDCGIDFGKLVDWFG